jgi:hypothetical protein
MGNKILQKEQFLQQNSKKQFRRRHALRRFWVSGGVLAALQAFPR